MSKEGKRLLAAIMFTDMVGYTALMQENEHQAIINRDRHRSVQQDAVSRHSGKILQYYGDGTLIIFNSSIEAVGCAVEVQAELQKEPRVPLRIGIHTGDIVYDDEGIYGDGVNIASRLESLAVSGSILVSEKLVDDIRNQPTFNFQSLGPFNLKNVKQPVEIYAICNEGLTVPEPEQLHSKKDEHVKSIAVLPFVNISSDTENEYFSDGITEEILNALAKVEGLMVTARTSSFAFKGKNLDIREIGKQLGVKAVLEGSVRKAGKRVRITSQLISVTDGYHVWSETYDRLLEDIFEIQDEISLKISNMLREKLCTKGAKEKLVIPSTYSLDAYNLYLKSLFYQNKWTLTDSKTAIELLKQAIELDPDFALAYAELSGVYGFLGATGKLPPQTAYAQSKEYALKANQLEGNLPESYLALSNVYFWLEWDWKKANKYINEAIKHNPSFAEAYLYKGIFSAAALKLKEAFTYLQLSRQLDPFSAPASHFLALIYYGMDKIDKSLEQLDATLKLDSNFLHSLNLKGWLYAQKQEYKKAAAIFKNIVNIPENKATALSYLGRICAQRGETETARSYLEQLTALEKEKPGQSFAFQIALLYAALEDIDNMFLYLEKSLEARNGDIIWLNFYKSFKPYQSDPRYIGLNKKLGLLTP